MSRGLSAVSTHHLRELLAAIETGGLACPIGSTALQSRGLGAAAGELGLLMGLDAPAVRAVLIATMAERDRPKTKLELVWTGAETPASEALDTSQVVERLFANAKESVLVSSYGFTKSRRLYEPLAAAVGRGVAVRLFFGFQERPDVIPAHEVDAFVAKALEGFFADNWPEGAPRPEVWFDRLTLTTRRHLHAKCVVVDGRQTLVTSANFTERGQTRNLELGVLIEDPLFANRVTAQWNQLVGAGLVERYRTPDRVVTNGLDSTA